MAAFAFLFSLVLCPGAGAGSDAAPVPIPFQQASFNSGSSGSPSVLSALQSGDVALNASRNPAFQSAIPGNADLGPQDKPALAKRAPQAAGMSQPLTMLVLGAGMIGLASLGRRKFHDIDERKVRTNKTGDVRDTLEHNFT